MREIVVISGKGGTGKTSLTGAFAHLAQDKIICDLDVDAPDLHILLSPHNTAEYDFYSGHEAVINQDLCSGCGTCMEMCRYNAVRYEEKDYFVIDPLRCEGCKVCVVFCPEKAVDFPERHCGKWFISTTRFGLMVHAALLPGSENSGRLVTLLRSRARQMAIEQGKSLILSDGAPGIGCPVISSLSNTDLAVVVTEPSLSGLHDLKRVGNLCSHFKVKVAVIINKFNLNPEQSVIIEEYCRSRGYHVAGRLIHDQEITRAMVNRKVITETENKAMAEIVRRIWEKIMSLL